MIKIKLKQRLDMVTGKVTWAHKTPDKICYEADTLPQIMLFALESMREWNDGPFRFKLNHYIDIGRVTEGKHRAE